MFRAKGHLESCIFVLPRAATNFRERVFVATFFAVLTTVLRDFGEREASFCAKLLFSNASLSTLSIKKYKEILSLAKKAHQLLGCKGITRSDFIFFNNKFYLLETNTQPGMTKLSLVPEIAKYCGIKFEDLVVKMVKDASCKR